MPPPERAEVTATATKDFFQHYRNETPNLFEMEFPYLEENRIGKRQSKYGKTQYDYSEEQLANGLFPVEAKGILDLLEACEKTNMDRTDIEHIIPAVHIFLYAHQTQFRESGEPYTIHPLEMAVEAARDYKADWQTVALCLLHDVKEDGKKYKKEIPPWVVESIYVNAFRGENNENLAQAIKDAKLLVKGMDALSKARTTAEPSLRDKAIDKSVELFRRKDREKHAARETVKKLYKAALSKRQEQSEDLVRIVLVKLLDRRHNMRTIQYMPADKQLEKATETLLIYAPMAEAFHLYKLADELQQLALEVLEPEEKEEIQQEIDASNRRLNKYASAEVLGLIYEILNQSKQECFQVETLPLSYFDMFDLINEGLNGNTNDGTIQLVINDRSDESDDVWNERLASIFGVILGALNREDEEPDLSWNIENIEAGLSEGVLNFPKMGEKSDQIKVRIVGKTRYISEHASLFDLFTRIEQPFGDDDQWRLGAFRNIIDVRKRLKKAKKQKDPDLFFETVSGNTYFDKNGNLIYLPAYGSVLDLAMMIYGDEVLRSLHVVLRKGKKTEVVKREDYGKHPDNLSQVVGLEVWDYETLSQKAVTPDDIRHSRVRNIKSRLVDVLEQTIKEESQRHDIEDYGRSFLSSDFQEAWKKHLGHEPLAHLASDSIPLSAEVIKDTWVKEYSTTEELNYSIGIGKIKPSLYRKIIKEMVAYRADCVFLSLKADNYAQKRQNISHILTEYNIHPVASSEEVFELIHPQFLMWFHESELGNEEIRMANLTAMFRKFEEAGFYVFPSWNKIPVVYGLLPAIETVDHFTVTL